jgi:hypothetical protein
MERGINLTYLKDLGNNRWIIEVKGKGGNNEELYIELPVDALNQMGWAEGNIIVWEEQDNGSFVLTKKVS